MGTSDIEYKNKKGETPFETFLKYTNEKEVSSTKLAKILQKIPKIISILDIGTGNGEYLGLTLSKIKNSKQFRLTLVEPSTDLAKQLTARFAALLPQSSVKVICSNLDGFSGNEKYDVVLASHLFYHLPRTTWPKQLEKMLALVKPNGLFVIVLRGEDDAYAFKMAFKPLIFDKNFKALTIDDVLDALPDAAELTITRHLAVSELHIPISENMGDTISIIEFYLNKRWEDIPENIQNEALDFIRNKHNIFKQIDGIAVIEKISSAPSF